MARRQGREGVYEVADQFRGRCLREGTSLLWPTRACWTPANLSALWNAFIGRPDEGRRKFLKKWHDQLLNEPEDVHRIAADLMAFYYLFPTNVGKQAKLNDLKTLFTWKLTNDQPDLGSVERAFEVGLGNPGISYLTGRPWQIAYYLEFSKESLEGKIDVTDLPKCKLLADRIKDEVQQSSAARHILLHLFFPEQFEPIASERYKAQIVQAFPDEAGGKTDLDEALLGIRKSFETKLGTSNFNFWDEQIRPLWDPAKSTEVNWWIEKTHVRGRRDREHGEFAVGQALWSPQKGKRLVAGAIRACTGELTGEASGVETAAVAEASHGRSGELYLKPMSRAERILL